MRIAVLLASDLAASCFVSSLKAEEVIKDKSPDGKLALQVYNSEEGLGAAIVDVRTKKHYSISTFTEPQQACWKPVSFAI